MTMSRDSAPPLHEVVSDEIRALMARRRVSQATVAAAAGLTQSALSRRLTGDVALTLNELESIARVLQVRPVDLVHPGLGAVTIRYPTTPTQPPVRSVRLRQMANWGMRDESARVRPPDHRPNGRPWPDDHSLGTVRPVRVPRAAAA